MKKLIIAAFVAAFFAACNNTPAVNESATKVAGLTTWVDSIKNVIATSTTHDSASWAGYNASFQEVVGSIKMEELDEAGKAALTAATNSWAEVGANYTTMMNDEIAKAKAAADTAAAAPAVEGDKTVIEKVKEAVKGK